MTRARDVARGPRQFSAPAAGAVDVWLARIPDGWSAGAAADVLDDSERERTAAFLRDSDRNRYAASHVMLRHLLGGYLAVAPDQVRFARDRCPCCGSADHGRPIVAPATHPEPPQFSLSHAGSLVAVAVAADPVGADVEAWPKAETVRSLAASLHPAERREIAEAAEGAESGESDGPARAFARLWTRKEAYLKGIGTGLGRDLGLDYVGSRLPVPDGWWITDLPVDDGYAAAVAVRSPGAAVARLTWLDLDLDLALDLDLDLDPGPLLDPGPHLDAAADTGSAGLR